MFQARVPSAGRTVAGGSGRNARTLGRWSASVGGAPGPESAPGRTGATR